MLTLNMRQKSSQVFITAKHWEVNYIKEGLVNQQQKRLDTPVKNDQLL